MILEKNFSQAREISEKMISIYPGLYQGHLNLARLALEEKDYAAASRSLKRSLACDPNQYLVHGELAVALFEQKQVDQSLFHLQESLRLNPGYLKALNSLAMHAWLRATSKDQEYYDPPKALILIRQAMELTPEIKKRAGLLRTLAAAYAANGNFPEAVENGRLAVQLAMSHGQKQIAREIQKQMELYRNNTAYRE